MATARPNFFIVGAPKCGTTALYTYLRQHPDVFMPELKETNFFCPEVSPSVIPDMQQYLALFAAVSDQSAIGEASVWYLYSADATRRLDEFSPGSRIIIMLRQPVDMLYSLHSQRLYNGIQSITGFRQALEDGSQRPGGKAASLVIDDGPPAGPFTLDLGRYTGHVERYLRAFGEERVKIILYDDFSKDTEAVYKDVLSFLDVDPSFTPSLEVINSNRHVRNVLLHRIVRTPSTPIRALARALVPSSLRPWVAETIVGFNSERAPREPLQAELRQRLTRELAPDIESLGRLLGRDLTHWCAR